MKKIFSFFILVLLVVFSFSCKKKESFNGVVIASTVNPNLGFAFYMESLFPKRYKVKVLRSPAEVFSTMKKGKISVFFHTIPGSIKLYKKGVLKNYVVLFPYVFNAVYLITRNKIEKFSDLRGKTLYIAYKGGSPDMIFHAIIRKEKLSPKDFDVVYQKPVVITKMFLKGKVNNTILMEYFVSKIMLEIKDVYVYPAQSFLGGEDIPLGGVIINKSFSELLKLENDIRYAINHLNRDYDDFISRISIKYKSFGIALDKKAFKSALKNKRILYKIPSDMQKVKKVIMNVFNVDEGTYKRLFVRYKVD